MVLIAKSGSAEGKPQVEEYGLGGLAASADAVTEGLGPLAVMLARLAGQRTQARQRLPGRVEQSRAASSSVKSGPQAGQETGWA
jgi:hypothetical protein